MTDHLKMHSMTKIDENIIKKLEEELNRLWQ